MTAVAAWPTFEAKVRDRVMIADGTMAVWFDRPEGWTYRAGQFIDITLLSPPETDAEGNTRGFSIASAPFEDGIMIATRLRDTAFKRVLRRMPLDTPVRIEGPFGDLRLHKAPRPAVVLTGGIGITPFRSILWQAVHEGGLPNRTVLAYANRRPEDAAFLGELDELAEIDRNLQFVPTMTAMERSRREWQGERGRVDALFLERHLEGIEGAIHYLTGPPGMVRSLRSLLIGRGVDEDDIRTEEFTGY